jgi:hypothetical protein
VGEDLLSSVCLMHAKNVVTISCNVG